MKIVRFFFRRVLIKIFNVIFNYFHWYIYTIQSFDIYIVPFFLKEILSHFLKKKYVQRLNIFLPGDSGVPLFFFSMRLGYLCSYLPISKGPSFDIFCFTKLAFYCILPSPHCFKGLQAGRQIDDNQLVIGYAQLNEKKM